MGMNIVLIPGFWLTGDSWSQVTPALVAAGHTVHPITRSGDTLAAQVEFVTAAVDAIGGPVVLVGHSGGGPIAYGVADARPDSVTRVVYVDSGPQREGGVINDELPVVDGEIPLPDWSVFEAEDLVDLTDELRAHFISVAVPEPARVASDEMRLTDERRYDVPATVICCEFTAEQLRGWIDAGVPFASELAAIKDYELVDLPTGHWPQFTKPAELGAIILAAVDR